MTESPIKVAAFDVDENRRIIEGRIRDVLDAHGKGEDGFAGFAIVVWGFTGSSTGDMAASADGTMLMPDILIPDFVRNRLLAYKIEAWTVDTVNGRSPPKDPA